MIQINFFKKKSELLLKKMLQLEKFECQLDIENIKSFT